MNRRTVKYWSSESHKAGEAQKELPMLAIISAQILQELHLTGKRYRNDVRAFRSSNTSFEGQNINLIGVYVLSVGQ